MIRKLVAWTLILSLWLALAALEASAQQFGPWGGSASASGNGGYTDVPVVISSNAQAVPVTCSSGYSVTQYDIYLVSTYTAPTVTFTACAAGQSLAVNFIQDNTGGITPTIAAAGGTSILWQANGGTQPTITTANNAVDWWFFKERNQPSGSNLTLAGLLLNTVPSYVIAQTCQSSPQYVLAAVSGSGASGNCYNLYGTAATFTALTEFGAADLAILGSSTGYTNIESANASATNYVATLPAATDTVTENTQTQTLTHKNLADSTNTFPVSPYRLLSIGNTLQTSATTAWFFPFTTFSSGTTEANAETPAPFTATYTSLNCWLTSAQGASNSDTMTFLDVTSSCTSTISTTSTNSKTMTPTTGSCSVTAGDLITIQDVTAGTSLTARRATCLVSP